MSELHLDSLEIKNFRCFEHLTIEKLGRVNLIVGKNSVGKTALLEALWLFNTDFDWPIIHKILYDRNELVRYRAAGLPSASHADAMEENEQFEALKSFFYGRSFPQNTPILYSLNTLKYFNSNTALGSPPILPPTTECRGSEFTIKSQKALSVIGLKNDPYGKGFLISKPNIMYPTMKPDMRLSDWPSLPDQVLFDIEIIDSCKQHKTHLIPVSGLTWKFISSYSDDLLLTDKEESILPFLQIIDSSIKRFAFKGENLSNRIKCPIVKSDKFKEPLPLANFGEGIQRAFAMALAMSAADNGILLIDEFETGLHHSKQTDIWRSIFKLAKDWNVQVFATTHSEDCITAFHEAAAENEDEDAMLIRLQKKRDGSGIVVATYNKKSMDVVTRQGIEVR